MGENSSTVIKDKTADATNSDRFSRCQHFFRTVRHSEALGIELIRVEERVAIARLSWKESLLGDLHDGVLHGGAITSLIDQVGGMSIVCAMYPNSTITPTIDLRVDYMRRSSNQDVVCHSDCYRLTEHVAFVRSIVYEKEEGGRVIATGQATYTILPRERISRPGKSGDANQHAPHKGDNNHEQN